MTGREAGGVGGGVDWAEIRQRIDALGRSLAGAGRRAPAEAASVLEARARALATPPASADAGPSLELVLFDLAEETYAIEARLVANVCRPLNVALVPGAEPPFFAITAWRGELLPVLDLAYLLRGTVGEPRAAELVLVLGEAPSAFGVAIDGVQPLRRVAPAGIRPLTGEGGRGARLLRGITDDAVLVLSGEELVQLHY